MTSGFIALLICSTSATAVFASNPAPASDPSAQLSPDEANGGFRPLFNGQDLTNWVAIDGAAGTFEVKDGVLVGDRKGRWDLAYWLSSDREYADFELRLQYRIESGGNSGIFIRAPREGRASRNGMEIQIVDDGNKAGQPNVSSTAAIYQVAAPAKFASRPAGEWNDLWILCDGERVQVTLNGAVVNNVSVSQQPKLQSRPRRGYIGLSAHTKPVNFRNVRIREIGASPAKEPVTRPAASTTPLPPNIVFILADDLGWRDTGVYGSTFHQTPNIDRLARRGVRFTNAYAANPLCSPTRCSILTGLYPGRVGVTTPSCHVLEAKLEITLPDHDRPDHKMIEPSSATRLKTTFPTLVKTLKQGGYVTGHFGKWHLGREPYSARDHGFDVDLPHYPGPGPARYLAPWRFDAALNFVGRAGEHIEDRMGQEAVKFIRENKDRPFYLNYWAFSVHGPWEAKKELIQEYKAKAKPGAPQRNPVYAAMVHSLDDAVGTLLDTLDELGLSERTIVVFFSDNGGVHWLDDRMRQQFGLESPPTSNAPLRGGKATLYEGGTREPCIVVWPGRTRPDSISEALLSSVDWYPTLLEMAAVQRASGQLFDGVSQVPALLGTGEPREYAFCYFPYYVDATGNIAGVWARRGDYKLIRFFGDNPDYSDRFELYNLKQDIGETKNLAGEMPDRVKGLNELIDQHLEEIHAPIPRPNPAYRPASGPSAP